MLTTPWTSGDDCAVDGGPRRRLPRQGHGHRVAGCLGDVSCRLLCQEEVQLQFWMHSEKIWDSRLLQNEFQKGFEPLENLSRTLPRTNSTLSIQNTALPLTHYPLTRPGGMGAVINLS